MAGETDLGAILASLRIERRPEPVTVLTVAEPVGPGPGIEALIVEDEGLTVVATVAEAERRGWPVGFVGAWLTVAVHTSLEGVGLTAVLARALADVDVACNVIAGNHHDHLLVPLERAEVAIEAIEALVSSRS